MKVPNTKPYRTLVIAALIGDSLDRYRNYVISHTKQFNLGRMGSEVLEPAILAHFVPGQLVPRVIYRISKEALIEQKEIKRARSYSDNPQITFTLWWCERHAEKVFSSVVDRAD